MKAGVFHRRHPWERDRQRMALRWDDFILLRNLLLRGCFTDFDDAEWLAVVHVTGTGVRTGRPN